MSIPLRALAPNTGAYINEVSIPFFPDHFSIHACVPHGVIWLVLTHRQASALDPDWRRLYWGTNYERLLSIKREVDPTDVFWCPLCVGNERWQEVDGRVCRVDGLLI